MTAADVATCDPVNLEVLGEVILPGEEIVVTLELCMFDSATMKGSFYDMET